MGPCNIKSSAEAWNFGVDTFEKAFLSSGKMTESLNYAISETQKNFPNLDFSVKSFSDPLIEAMKETGDIPASYSFGKKSIDDKISEVKSDIEKLKAGTYTIPERKEKGFSTDKEIELKKLQKEKNEELKKLNDEKYKGYKSDEKNDAAQRNYEKKILSIAEKMDGLSSTEKQKFAKQLFSKALNEGYITEDAVKTAYAQAMGLPTITPKVEESINKMADANKEVDRIEQEKIEKIKELQSLKLNQGLTPELDEEIDKFLKDIKNNSLPKAKENARIAAAELAQQMEPLSFWEWRLFSRANMNLMGIKTLIKNLTGGVADTFIRQMGNAVGSTISTIVSKVIRKNNPLPFGKRALGGIEASNKIYKNVKTAIKTGDTTYDKKLPGYNHMSAVTKLRQAIDATGLEKIKLYVSTLLRVSPDAISRTLAATDQIFNSSVYEGELASIAESKGLKGAEKTAFIMEPDEKSKAYAQKKADEATFKDDNIITKSKFLGSLKSDPLKIYENFITQGKSKTAARMYASLFHAASTIITPFVKTPVNIMRQAARYILPEFELAKSLMDAKTETDPNIRQRIVYDAVGRVTVGIMLRNVAMNMVAQGLITAGFKDDDPESKDTIESVKHGPNRINATALMRALAFQGVYSKKNDTWIELSALGVPGIVMGTYAHYMSSMSEEEKIEASTPSIGGEAYLFLSEFQSALDNTFLSGTNQALEAINDKTGNKGSKFSINALMVMMAGFIPATAQTLSTQSDEKVKRQFDPDKSFTENLYSAFGYKLLAQSEDLKNKYFNLASEDKYGPKKKDYMYFDNYLGRVLEANLDVFKPEKVNEGSPENRLLVEMGKAKDKEKGKLFPPAVGDIQSFSSKINGKSQRYSVQLTTEQHEYLMQQAGKYRLMQATPYIMSEAFESQSFEVKTKFLQEGPYKEGLEMAKKDLLANFPEVKTQRVETNNEDTKKEVKKLKKKY